MNSRKIAIAISLLLALTLAGCDDDEENSANQGGGQGSANPTDISPNGSGFCDPTGGGAALGAASYTSSSTAKLDFDGDPNGGTDPDYNPNTSATVNGQPVNSATYNYVVLSPAQLAANGLVLGDWATVTNNATGATTYARVSDVGPAGGTGEISEAAATAVGIQFTPTSATIGNPSVTVNAYAGTAAIGGDCSTTASL